MRVVIRKAQRTLELWDGDALMRRCRAALGKAPVGAKRAQGDGKTPEGIYTVCIVKEQGKYGRSLGLDYPNAEDAERAFAENRIDQKTRDAILLAHARHARPPWGTSLGGEIYIHEGGSASDWTAGCVALDSADMDALYPRWREITEVELLP